MSHLNKKALGTGVAMVALSSFVPNPFLTGDAWAQASASDTLNITAKIVNPLGVSQLTKLNFGTFAVKSAGDLSINSAGVHVISKGVIISSGTNGKVALTAPKSATFTVSIPDFAAGVITLSTAGAGGATSKTIKVTKLFVKATANMAGYTKTFKSGGNVRTGAKVTTGTIGNVAIGGIVQFKANNLPGTYTGSYTMLTTF